MMPGSGVLKPFEVFSVKHVHVMFWIKLLLHWIPLLVIVGIAQFDTIQRHRAYTFD